MNIYLERFGSIPGQGTFGELVADDFTCKTVEREWLGNRRNVSCIPAGDYQLIPHHRPSGELVYAVVNESLGVYRYPHEDAKRDLILIHTGNIMTDLAGCIAPGAEHAGIFGKFGVNRSRDTMTELKKHLAMETHTLHIRWQNYRDA